MDEYELYHWGVKGMKWGVRRYQNADGSLTGAGRRRYAKGIAGKIKNASGRHADITDLTEAVSEDIKSHPLFKTYKKEAAETWRKYLEASHKSDADYENTIKKIHKDPKFKAEVEKMEAEALKQYPNKDSRGYAKYMEYGLDSLEYNHPLFKEHEKLSKHRDELFQEALNSAKKLTDEIVGKYGNKPATNAYQYSYKVRDVVNNVVNSEMMADYYSRIKKK